MNNNRLIPKLDRRMSAYEFLTDWLPNNVFKPEPKRLHMSHWVEYKSEDGHYFSGTFPECGTIGCIGGWTEITTGNRWDGRVIEGAGTILGLTSNQRTELFMPYGYSSVACFGRQGTLEHVEKVIEHIRAFAATYEAQLRATMVEPARS